MAHGAGSDPTKISRYRALCRLRRTWLADGRGQLDDPAFGAFSQFLLLVPEHTWGLDTKKHLGDWAHYDAPDFAAVRSLPHYREFASSWAEQRAYLDSAVEALGASPLAEEVTQALERLQPLWPDRVSWTPVPAGTTDFETARFRIGVDPANGALTRLDDTATGRSWASPDHPLGLV